MLALSTVLKGCQSYCFKCRIWGVPGAALKCQSQCAFCLFIFWKHPYLERERERNREGRRIKRRKGRERQMDGQGEGEGLKDKICSENHMEKGRQLYMVGRGTIVVCNLAEARSLPLSGPQFFI